jgi:hypothetical protein
MSTKRREKRTRGMLEQILELGQESLVMALPRKGEATSQRAGVRVEVVGASLRVGVRVVVVVMEPLKVCVVVG